MSKPNITPETDIFVYAGSFDVTFVIYHDSKPIVLEYVEYMDKDDLSEIELGTEDGWQENSTISSLPSDYLIVPNKWLGRPPFTNDNLPPEYQ